MKITNLKQHKEGFSARLPEILLTVFMILFCVVDSRAQKDVVPEHTSRYYYDRASNYQDAESWDASKREIDEGLKYYPNDPDLRYLNGRYYYYGQGDLHQARYNLVKAVQENDQHYRAKRVLVDVEDDARHFSSAICYINELLEFQPYDRDLWRRKIALYRKIGQKTEADHALERLARIYPNDSVVRRDLNNRNREEWNKRLQTSSLSDAANDLEKWLDIEPDNIDYYQELVRVYQKMGDYERAIGAANRGLSYHPGNTVLINSAASMMAELGNYTRALSFLREHKNTGTLYNAIVRQAADDARWRDPYEANGRLYAMTGDADALTYLMNTALTRGYYPDAIDYLNEAYSKQGRTPELLIKQYALEKRFGNEKQEYALLEELYTKTPDNEEIMDDYIAMMIALSNRDIEQEQWTDAYNHLDKAISLMQPDSASGWPAAVSRQISVLGRMNRLDEARQLYHQAVDRMPQFKDRFGYAYEEIAAARLKKLIEDENYELALTEAESLLEVVEDSEAALRTCINMSQTLKKDEKFIKYADMGYSRFPGSPYFIVKKATALEQEGKYDEALALVTPKGTDEYVNPQLMNAFVGISTDYAIKLLKDHEPEKAIEVMDAALKYDEENKDLLYMKGIAYEQMHDFGQAYDYQRKYYNPTNAEQADWYQHMKYLRYKSYKNHIDASYTSAFYDNHVDDYSSIAHLYSIATVTYSHIGLRNTWTGQISYKGVDGYLMTNNYSEGGFGLEFMAQWDHVWSHSWSSFVNASYSTKYFNKIGANIGAGYEFDPGWLASLKLGYRLTAPTAVMRKNDELGPELRYSVFIATPSIEKSWSRIKASAGVDLIGMSTGFYYNVGLKGKIFVNEDNVSSVSLLAGFGSFPELNFFDQTALPTLAKTNAMVGLDGLYMFTHNFSAGLSGAWNTYYNPGRLADGTLRNAYRNVFSATLHLHVAF